MSFAAPIQSLSARRQRLSRLRWCLSMVCLLAGTFAHAASPSAETKIGEGGLISIIIDDLGNQFREGKKVILLPGAVTVSIMPYTPFAVRLAKIAQDNHKEIMLHLPMESVDERFLGRGGLNERMDQSQFDRSLYQSLGAVPDIRGVNNHMGSRLTQDATRMSWLMAGLLRHGDLYFVDSRTTRLSQADTEARKYGLEHARRDVFLDDSRDPVQIGKQWNYLIRLAKRQGSAIAIGHPYPETVLFLQQVLPTLREQGIQLLPVSKLIEWRQTRRSLAWQSPPSSSPSHKAAKNSKLSPSSICCAAQVSP